MAEKQPLTSLEASEKFATWVKERMSKKQVRRLAELIETPAFDWEHFRRKVVEECERKMKRMGKS